MPHLSHPLAPENGEWWGEEDGDETAGEVVDGTNATTGVDEGVGWGGDGQGHGDRATEGDGNEDGDGAHGVYERIGDDEADGEEDVGSGGVAHEVGGDGGDPAEDER